MGFKSFFIAGFECATGVNCRGQKIDQLAATQHDKFLDEDYERLLEIGIRTVREGVRWPAVDQGGELDLTELHRAIDCANRYGLELILDLFHYGIPDGLDVFDGSFGPRFAKYCGAVAETVARNATCPVHFTPVNEPSYFAWAAGEAAKFAPFLTGRAFEMKRALIGAAIQGIDAIRGVIPEARIINVDPICRVVAPVDDDSQNDVVRFFNEVAVFECWDMLAGKLIPELGGSPEHLDTVGVNYYWTNQWEIGKEGEPLSMDDGRLMPVSELLGTACERYGRPVVLTETSHVELMRGPWLRYISDEVRRAIRKGCDIQGICLYPILGMPEWHEPSVWTRMGLWNCMTTPDGIVHREPDERMMREYFSVIADWSLASAASDRLRSQRRKA